MKDCRGCWYVSESLLVWKKSDVCVVSGLHRLVESMSCPAVEDSLAREVGSMKPQLACLVRMGFSACLYPRLIESDCEWEATHACIGRGGQVWWMRVSASPHQKNLDPSHAFVVQWVEVTSFVLVVKWVRARKYSFGFVPL